MEPNTIYLVLIRMGLVYIGSHHVCKLKKSVSGSDQYKLMQSEFWAHLGISQVESTCGYKSLECLQLVLGQVSGRF